MTTLANLTYRTKRAALVGLLVAVPLLPVAACSDGGDSGDGGGAEVETGDSRGDGEDGGAY